MVMTLRRILEFSVVSQSHPRILGRPDLLETQVRRIHVAESAEVAGLLEGREMILSSGLTLTPNPAQISDFLTRFADAGAAGVIFSFLSDDAELKSQLSAVATNAAFPVVLLDDRARFVSITDSVDQLIKSAGSDQSASSAIIEFLSSASADRLGPMELFHAMADLLAHPLVLVNSLDEVVAHQGLSVSDLHLFLPAPSTHEFRQGFRSSPWVAVDIWHGRTEVGAIMSPVFRKDPRLSIAVERFTELLAQKLDEGAVDFEQMRRRARTEIVSDLRSATPIDAETAQLRAAVLGITEATTFATTVVHFHTGSAATVRSEAQSDQAVSPQLRTSAHEPRNSFYPLGTAASIGRLLDLAADKFIHFTRSLNFPVVLCRISSQDLGCILCLPPGITTESGLAAFEFAFTTWLRSRGQEDASISVPAWTMGAAGTARSLSFAATNGLDESRRVALAAVALEDRGAQLVRPVDLGFHWLAQGLVGTQDGALFVRDQLGPALDEPEYLDFIHAYIRANGNVTEVARTVHLSRPRVYARIRRIEEEWGLHLDDAEVRTSLHLALTLHHLGALVHRPNNGF